MSRRGRKRKFAQREPNGRVKRKCTSEREADVVSVAVDARVRAGVPKTLARTQEAGSLVGLALLAGDILKRHYEAACMFREHRADYLRTIDAEGLRSGSDVDRQALGYDASDPFIDSFHVEWCVHAKERYMDALLALGEGTAEHIAVDWFVVENLSITQPQMNDLRVGLTFLADHYRIPLDRVAA